MIYTGVIVLPTQTRYYKGDIPQNLHIFAFALFDPSTMGNLMIPITLKGINISHQARISKSSRFPPRLLVP